MKVFGGHKRQEGTAVKQANSTPDGSVSGSCLPVQSPFGELSRNLSYWGYDPRERDNQSLSVG